MAPPSPTLGSAHGALPQWQNFLASSLAPSLSVLVTNPLEVAKVRRQMVGELGSSKGVHLYRGPFQTLYTIGRMEGVKGLQAGLPAAILREGTKNLFRLGAYEPILAQLHDPRAGPAPIHKRLEAGGLSGAVAAYVCNPMEIVKSRLQAQTTAKESRFRYSGVADALLRIAREEGVTGLWKGSHISALRSAVNTATNLTTYTMMKEAFVNRDLLSEGVKLHVTCSLLASFATCTAGNPLDVVRTRLYNQPRGLNGEGLLYKSWLEAFYKIPATEGLGALYKGFWPHYFRVGPHFVLTFVILEQLRMYMAQRKSLQSLATHA